MKPTAPTLSQHLLKEALRFRGYPGLVGRGRVEDATTRMWNAFALPMAAERIELVEPRDLKFVHPPAFIDEYYSKALLAEIPAMVTRLLRQRPVDSRKEIPRQVNVYLQQATRSHVAGLWDGAVAMSRACLEAAIEDTVGFRVGHQQRSLDEWIDVAEERHILDRGQCERARRLKGLANVVLHDRSATEEEAKRTLAELRDFLAVAYGDGSRPGG